MPEHAVDEYGHDGDPGAVDDSLEPALKCFDFARAGDGALREDAHQLAALQFLACRAEGADGILRRVGGDRDGMQQPEEEAQARGC